MRSTRKFEKTLIFPQIEDIMDVDKNNVIIGERTFKMEIIICRTAGIKIKITRDTDTDNQRLLLDRKTAFMIGHRYLVRRHPQSLIYRKSLVYFIPHRCNGLSFENS